MFKKKSIICTVLYASLLVLLMSCGDDAVESLERGSFSIDGDRYSQHEVGEYSRYSNYFYCTVYSPDDYWWGVDVSIMLDDDIDNLRDEQDITKKVEIKRIEENGEISFALRSYSLLSGRIRFSRISDGKVKLLFSNVVVDVTMTDICENESHTSIRLDGELSYVID